MKNEDNMECEDCKVLLKELFTLVRDAPGAGAAPSETCLPKVYKAFNGKIILLEYAGSIGLPCAERFAPSLHGSLTGEAEQVVLYMKHVVKLSRTAIGIIVDFAAGVLGRGKELYVLQPRPEIKAKVDGMQLGGFFKVLQTEEELISILPVEYLQV